MRWGRKSVKFSGGIFWGPKFGKILAQYRERTKPRVTLAYAMETYPPGRRGVGGSPPALREFKSQPAIRRRTNNNY